jgi:hypothetical protein
MSPFILILVLIVSSYLLWQFMTGDISGDDWQ